MTDRDICQAVLAAHAADPRVEANEDEAIAVRIAQYLGWNASVSNDAVHVGVHSGWVTLGGKVDWGFQRLALERFVLRVEGVKGVCNLIEARRLATAERLCDWVRRTLHPAPSSGPEGMKLQ